MAERQVLSMTHCSAAAGRQSCSKMGEKESEYGTQGEGQKEPRTKQEVNGVVSRSLARWVENRSREISSV